MCEIKKGDYVKAKNQVWKVVETLGEAVELESFNGGYYLIANCNQVKKLPTDYTLSNRHRLAIRIQESGFDATALSLAAGKNKFYFGTEIKESRFNKCGDLSEKQTILLFGRLEQAIKKLENPTIDTPTPKQNLSLEAKTSFEELKPSDSKKAMQYDLGYRIYNEGEKFFKAKQEQAEKNFSRILILACLVLVLFFTVKINFF